MNKFFVYVSKTVIGIGYDYRSHKFIIGGRISSEFIMVNIMDTYLVAIALTRYQPGRGFVRYEGEIDHDVWQQMYQNLQLHFSLENTKSFGRLMR